MAATNVQLEWSDGQFDVYTIGETFDRAIGAGLSGQVRSQFIGGDGGFGPWSAWAEWSTVATSTSTLSFLAPTLRNASTILHPEVIG